MIAAPRAVRLRDVRDADLDVLFEQQRDPAANRMAAFAAPDPADRHAFDEHWRRLQNDRTVTVRCVSCRGRLAGYVVGFTRLGHPEVGYWIGRTFWGRGVATRALRLFLAERPGPLYARAAADNAASIRVLEKCGFRVHARDTAYANARAGIIDEVIFFRSAARAGGAQAAD